MKLYMKLSLKALVLITCLVWSPSSPAARNLVDRTVVTVNDEIILESDIGKFQKKLRSKSYQELLGVDEKVVGDREKVLQLLVEEKIIDQQVKKLDLKAGDQEVEGQIRSILKRNGITLPQLSERLKQLGTSMDDYREGLKRQIERRNLVEREIKPSLEVTDEQLRHFYLRNSTSSEAEVQYKIAHILISNRPGALDRAKKIHKEISQNTSEFEKFVKDYSDDDSTSGVGGVLGYFSLSQLAKEFRDVVPKAPLGSVTAPLKTAAGFHILRVLDKSIGDFAKLTKEQKDGLRNQMVASELEKKMGMWLERKKAESHIRRFVGGKNAAVK